MEAEAPPPPPPPPPFEDEIEESKGEEYLAPPPGLMMKKKKKKKSSRRKLKELGSVSRSSLEKLRSLAKNSAGDAPPPPPPPPPPPLMADKDSQDDAPPPPPLEGANDYNTLSISHDKAPPPPPPLDTESNHEEEEKHFEQQISAMTDAFGQYKDRTPPPAPPQNDAQGGGEACTMEEEDQPPPPPPLPPPPPMDDSSMDDSSDGRINNESSLTFSPFQDDSKAVETIRPPPPPPPQEDIILDSPPPRPMRSHETKKMNETTPTPPSPPSRSSTSSLESAGTTGGMAAVLGVIKRRRIPSNAGDIRGTQAPISALPPCTTTSTSAKSSNPPEPPAKSHSTRATKNSASLNNNDMGSVLAAIRKKRVPSTIARKVSRKDMNALPPVPPPPPPPPPSQLHVEESSLKKEDREGMSALLGAIQRRRVPSTIGRKESPTRTSDAKIADIGDIPETTTLSNSHHEEGGIAALLGAIQRRRIPSMVGREESSNQAKSLSTDNKAAPPRKVAPQATPSNTDSTEQIREQSMAASLGATRKRSVSSSNRKENISVMADSQKPPSVAPPAPPVEPQVSYEGQLKRYRNMLKAGLTEGAVRHRMAADAFAVPHDFFQIQEIKQTDGASPPKVAPPAVPPSPLASAETTFSGAKKEELNTAQLNSDPAFAKYKRMLLCGLPQGAVIHKMRQDGLNPPLLDSNTATTKSGTEEEVFGTARKGERVGMKETLDDPAKEKELVKLKNMLKAGLAIQAVQTKMELLGIEAPPGFFDLEDSAFSPHSALDDVARESTLPSPNFLIKYQKMLKCGLPQGAVRHKMAQDGITVPVGFFQDNHSENAVLPTRAQKEHRKQEEPETSSPAALTTDKQATLPLALSLSPSTSAASTDPALEKYRKMLKCGLPEGAVLHKMAQDRVDVPVGFFREKDDLTGFGAPPKNDSKVQQEQQEQGHRDQRKASHHSQTKTDERDTTAPPLVASVEEDHLLKKYRKMLKCGLPEGAVRHKMDQDGIRVPVGFFDSPEPIQDASPEPIQDESARLDQARSPGLDEDKPTPSTNEKKESRLGRLRRLSSRRRSSLQGVNFPDPSEEYTLTLPAAHVDKDKKGSDNALGDLVAKPMKRVDGQNNGETTSVIRDSVIRSMKTVDEQNNVQTTVNDTEMEVHTKDSTDMARETEGEIQAQLEREEAASIARDLQDAEERRQKAKTELEAAERAEQERIEAEKRLAEVRARQKEFDRLEAERQKAVAAKHAQEEKKRREQEEFERIKREVRDALEARSMAEVKAIEQEHKRLHAAITIVLDGSCKDKDSGFALTAEDFQAHADRRCELAECRSEQLSKVFEGAISVPFSRKNTSSIGDGDFWAIERELVEVSLERSRLDEKLVQAENQVERETALIAALEESQMKLEQACADATLPEDLIAQHINQLQSSMEVESAVFSQSVRAIERRQSEVIDEIARLDARDKHAYDMKYNATVMPEVNRAQSGWKARATFEDRRIADELEELSNKADRAKNELLRATEARFKIGFENMLAELDSEETRLAEQLAETQGRLEKVQEQAKELACVQGDLPNDSLTNVSFLQAASPEQVEKLVGKCITERELAAAQVQRAAIHGFAQSLSQSWQKMCQIGLVDQQVKHQLSFLYKVEQTIPFSQQVLRCYQRKISELQDALPIFETLKERDGLQRSVGLCHDFLKEQDLSKEEPEDRGVAQQVVEMLKRETDALRWSTVRAAKLVQSWEEKHGTQFNFC